MLLPARFWDKIQYEGECWIWQASKNQYGYGKYFHNGRLQGSHRVAYEAIVGPVTKGLELDHLCRNRACVNPIHLEPVTHQVNLLRGQGFNAINARKTHCKRGHELIAENLYTRKGKRRCNACHVITAREWRIRHAK